VIDRRCSKKRLRAPALWMLEPKVVGGSVTVVDRRGQQVEDGEDADRCLLAVAEMCSRL